MRIKDLRSIDTLSREISHRNAAFTSGTGDFSTPFHRLHDTLSFTTMLCSARNDRGGHGNDGVSSRQETIRKRFPTRRDTMAILTDRKLIAKGFLSGVTLWLFLPTGNCLRKVSYPAWHHGCPYRQETVCERFSIRLGTMAVLTDRKLFAERFPIRLGTMAVLTDRKLFAKGFLSGLAPWLSLPTGNCLLRVSHPA